MKKDKKADKLYKEFQEILKNEGDGEKMKKFIKKNFSKLPKNIQDRIVIILFTRSVDKIKKENNDKMPEIYNQGLELIKKLENEKIDLRNKIDTLEIRKSIG
ncbi:MAG: hypothetical protein HQ538_00405 [Parcubacteria group bacterium]|nr:hypothetical protein [Parcubacteria group bacterium]